MKLPGWTVILSVCLSGIVYCCPYTTPRCECRGTSITCSNLRTFPTLNQSDTDGYESLTFIGGSFTTVPDNSLPAGLSNLTFSNVPISSFSSNSLNASANTLKSLSIANSQLTVVPDALLQVNNLTSLSVQDAVLNFQNDAVLKHLGKTVRHLALVDVVLGKWPDWLRYFTSLEDLDFSQNGYLKTISGRTFPPQVTRFTASDCSISLLRSDSFPSGSALVSLDLSSTGLSAVEEAALTPLQRLETLTLRSTHLPGIPTAVTRLPNLTTLDVSSNSNFFCHCPRNLVLTDWYKSHQNVSILGSCSNGKSLVTYLGEADDKVACDSSRPRLENVGIYCFVVGVLYLYV